MSLQTFVAEEITAVIDNANGGFDHANNHCVVGTASVHKINDLPGQEYDGNGVDVEAAQGHIHAFWADNTGPNTAEVRVKFQLIGSVFQVHEVRLYVRVWRSGGTYTGAQFRPFLYLRSDPADSGTADYYYLDPTTWEVMPTPLDIDGDWVHAQFGGPTGPDQTFAGWAYVLKFPSLNPATGSPFTRADINSSEGGVKAKNDDDVAGTGPFVGTIRLSVVADASPDQQFETEEMASRYVYLHRQPLRHLTNHPVRWSISRALLPGDILKVAHFAGPEGWGIRTLQVRRFLVTKIQRRDDGYDAVSGVEWQEIPTLYYDSLLMKSNIDVTTEDGILRVSRGQLRTYARAGQAWEKDPGSDTYVLLEPNERPYSDKGLACFEEYRNAILYSAMKDGDITGWTKAGTGVNFSEIRIADEETGSQLGETEGWDKDSTGILQSILLIAGLPLAADLTVTSGPTESLPGSTKGTWQVIWTRLIVDQAGYAALQRGVDSFYLQGDGTWDATIFWHNLLQDNLGTRIGDPTGTTEMWSFGQIIDLGGSATTLSTVLSLPDGLGIPDHQATRFYHSQFVPDTTLLCPPPVVTEDASVTRFAGQATITNNIEAQMMLQSGCVGAIVTPAWRGSDQPDDTPRYVWSSRWDADNYIDLFFIRNRVSDSFTGWVLQVVSETSPFEALIDTSVIDVLPDLPVALVARLYGSESGLTTMTLFLIGMDAVPGGLGHVYSNSAEFSMPEMTDVGVFELGSKENANQLGGWAKILRTSAQTGPDEEILRFVR